MATRLTAANPILGGTGKTTTLAPKSSPFTSTATSVTDAVNGESQDQIMRAQIEWWKTHQATSPEQLQQKQAAYQYATDHGIKGAIYPNQTELETDPNFSQHTNWAGLAPVALGAAGGALVGGPVGALIGGAAGTVAGGVGSAVAKANTNSNAFKAGQANGANPALPGSPELATPGGAATMAGYPGAAGGGGVAPAGATGGTAGGGMTPQQISQLTGATLAQVTDPTSGPLYAALANSIQQRTQNQGYVTNQFMPALGTANTDINTALQNGNAAVANQYQVADQVKSGYGQLVNQQTGFANQANATDQGSLAGYGQNLGAATGMQVGAYNQLANTFGGMSQLSATPYTQNVQAAQAQAQLANYQTAALAQSNYQNAGLTLANYKDAQYQGYVGKTAQYQQAALERAGLSQASSDAGDVAAERAALGQLTGMAGGSLDTQNGAGSGGGSAAQQSALAQYGALTSPEATSKEKFLYESQREAQEQQEAASRAALMNDYRVRGVGGSGMELASILQAGQQNSQQRLLGDLGTQAGAVDRSMQALAGYGNLSSQMVAQGNQVNQANMANRLGAAGAQGQLASNIRGQSDALGMYNTGQANTVGMFNAGAYNQNAQFNAGAYNQNQMFNANVENDANAFNANAFNNNQQFNANAYNQNQISNAGFSNENSQFNANAYNANSMNNARLAESNNEFNSNAYNSNSQYNAGQVNSINVANAQQSNEVNLRNAEANGIQSRFADSFAAEQQSQAATRANDLATQGINVGQNFASNSTNAFNAQTGVTNTAFDRNTGVTKLGENALTAAANSGTTANNAAMNQSGQQLNAAGQKFGNTLAVGNAWMGAGTQGTTAINSGLNTIAGDSAAKAAIAAASKPSFNYLDPNTW